MTMVPPPGWYDDPDGSGDRRYWDGSEFTSARTPSTSSRPFPGDPQASTVRKLSELQRLEDKYSSGALSYETYSDLKSELARQPRSNPRFAPSPSSGLAEGSGGRRLQKPVLAALMLVAVTGAALAFMVIGNSGPGTDAEAPTRIAPSTEEDRIAPSAERDVPAVEADLEAETDDGSGVPTDMLDPHAFNRGLNAGRSMVNAGFQNPSVHCQSEARQFYRSSPLSRGEYLQGCLAGASGG